MKTQALIQGQDCKRSAADDLPDILTPSQAASLTGLSSKTVRKMCEAGTIPAYRPIGSLKWLISKRKLMELVESGS